MKLCRTCERNLPLSEYHKDRARPDGHKYVCKTCLNKKNKKRYWKDPEKRREIVRKSRKKNPERVAEYNKWYRENYPEKVKECQQRWIEENRERIKRVRKEYNKRNKEKNREYAKKYREDEKVRLIHNLRVRIPRFVRRGGVSESTKKLLGCNLGRLKNHLESQFEDGMSWDNYGEWEIDHIVPVASLKESDNIKQEAKEVFHYTNLQPLWSYENKSKGNRINHAS